ncbi:hypothetical protein [Aridibaculum aurantiacum]|uniref:hypothetical protein n=1 Tax=Aridibaculum aurantiacum TaxID=2810307 RepID=UPI001A96893C|nr:hypothetical protein [Aridibaculum aurantiacum]
MLFVFAVASCSQQQPQQAEEEKGKYKFIYYPNMNMYYDVAAGQYLFSIDSARTWQTINEPSTEQPATLGEGKVIYTDVKQVWKENEEHRQQHDGTIYNVLSGGAVVASAANEVSERKTPRKTVAKPAPVEEPKKKGLGKFLNNIFGKKKNKDQQ